MPLDCFATHAPVWQYLPGAQSAVVVQTVRQAPAAHLKSPHDTELLDVLQVPEPLHSCLAKRVSLSTHSDAPQVVPVGVFARQLPVPSQTPSAPHSVPDEAHSAWGVLAGLDGRALATRDPGVGCIAALARAGARDVAANVVRACAADALSTSSASAAGSQRGSTLAVARVAEVPGHAVGVRGADGEAGGGHAAETARTIAILGSTSSTPSRAVRWPALPGRRRYRTSSW